MPHDKLQDALDKVTETLEGAYEVEVELAPISSAQFFEIIKNKESLWLNWQHYMPQFWEKRDSVHFVVKPKDDETLLSGVVGYYDAEKKQLCIGLLEHFVKEDNPIKGTLIKLMATVALYFLVIVDGDGCIVFEPIKEVVKEYKKVGFYVTKYLANGEVDEMQATTGEIMDALRKLS
ncbi:hypothetical protein L1D61_10330 [Vibrio mediterranei]|nr:hypothetical protein [Vibrio mediterranei]